MPLFVLVVWFTSRRSELATGAALFLGFGVIMWVTRWADARPAKLPLARWIDGIELTEAEQRLGFKVLERGDKDGTFLLVAPQNERAATDEVKRLGLYRAK